MRSYTTIQLTRSCTRTTELVGCVCVCLVGNTEEGKKNVRSRFFFTPMSDMKNASVFSQTEIFEERPFFKNPLLVGCFVSKFQVLSVLAGVKFIKKRLFW